MHIIQRWRKLNYSVSSLGSFKDKEEKKTNAPLWQMKGWVVLHSTSFHFPVLFTITVIQSRSLLLLLNWLEFQKRKEELLWSDHNQGSLNSPIHTSFFAVFLTSWFSEEFLTFTRSVWKVLQNSWASLQDLFCSIRI